MQLANAVLMRKLEENTPPVEEEAGLPALPDKHRNATSGKVKRTKRGAKQEVQNAEADSQHVLDELAPGYNGAATDDLASAWEQCKADGAKWGGRGRGGRAVARQQASMSTHVRDVYVENFTLMIGGRELLQESQLRLIHGRRYALMGNNGVGKSSLLHRIALGKVPGFPQHLRVALVAQEEARAPPAGKTTSDWLVSLVSTFLAPTLEREKSALEEAMDELDLADGSAESAELAH